MIEIDGSQGEGGGQILRTALALSLVTGQAFRLQHIRAKRSKPGLMRQHLSCVQAAVAVGGGAPQCKAHTADGAPLAVGATSLVFEPGPVQPGHFEFAIGSAGSCMLVLQTVLWPLALATQPSTLVLRGGTHNPMAPTADFLRHMVPYFAGTQAANAAPLFDLPLRRHGFYPAGGGEVHVTITPPVQGLGGMALTQRGALLHAWAESIHAGVPAHVAQRQLDCVRQTLQWSDAQLRNRGLRGNEGPGNALQLVLQFEHITEVITAFGDKGVSAERVAQLAIAETQTYLAHTAPVGAHLADQLLIPMALAAHRQGHRSSFVATELTQHALTNMDTIQRFLPVRFATQTLGTGGWQVQV